MKKILNSFGDANAFSRIVIVLLTGFVSGLFAMYGYWISHYTKESALSKDLLTDFGWWLGFAFTVVIVYWFAAAAKPLGVIINGIIGLRFGRTSAPASTNQTQ